MPIDGAARAEQHQTFLDGLKVVLFQRDGSPNSRLRFVESHAWPAHKLAAKSQNRGTDYAGVAVSHVCLVGAELINQVCCKLAIEPTRGCAMESSGCD